jgi:hypothetical protein
MPQSVYSKIAAPYSETCPGCANLIEDNLSSIYVQKSSSIDLTVTRDDFDPATVFGEPPNISWKVIGQGAAISPATGIKATLTTDGSFSECEVEVTITRGATTRTVRKAASTTAVASQNSSARLHVNDIQIMPFGNGAVKIAVPGVAQSIAVYKADGTRIFYRETAQGNITVPAHVFARGIYFFHIRLSDGQSWQTQWPAGLAK